ncbi:MAG: hypothetical protein PVJ57_02760 [Phycisphaerae bacterium]|jgi:hypothetical protein
MRALVVVTMFAVLLGLPALAQQDYPMPAMPQAPKPGTPRQATIQEKLRYICKQLDLNEKQKQHVEGLFVLLEAEANSPPEELQRLVDEIQDTYQKMMAAREAGDTERAEELRETLIGLSPIVAAERNFAEGLMPALTEEQRAKFEYWRKKLEHVTDLSLKPLDVLRLAATYNLNDEQRAKVNDLRNKFRNAVALLQGDRERETALLEQLIKDVAAVLDESVRAEFLKQIDKLRPDEVAPAASDAPTSAPAAEATEPTPVGQQPVLRANRPGRPPRLPASASTQPSKPSNRP